MLKNTINLDQLKIIKDEFIDFETNLIEEFQRGFLIEDMFLGKSILKNIYLDIGWVSMDEIFENGYFKILIIENDEWDLPLVRLKAIKKEELVSKIKVALLFLKEYERIEG